MVYSEKLVNHFPIVNHDLGARFYDLCNDVNLFKELTTVLDESVTTAFSSSAPSSSLVSSLLRVIECHKTFLTKLNREITTPLSLFYSASEKQRTSLTDEVHKHTTELTVKMASLESMREECMSAYERAVHDKDASSCDSLADLFSDYEILSTHLQQQQDLYSLKQVPAILNELEILERARLEKAHEMTGVFIAALLAYRGQLTAVHQSCVGQHHETPHYDRIVHGLATQMAEHEGIVFQAVPRLPITSEAIRAGNLTRLDQSIHATTLDTTTSNTAVNASSTTHQNKENGHTSHDVEDDRFVEDQLAIVRSRRPSVSSAASTAPATSTNTANVSFPDNITCAPASPLLRGTRALSFYRPRRSVYPPRLSLTPGEEKDVKYKAISNVTRQIFDALDIDGTDSISSTYLLAFLERNGLLRDDPRLRVFMEELEALGGVSEHVALSLSEFDMAICSCSTLVQRCITGQLRIPDFDVFCGRLQEVYNKVLPNVSGANADYIPQLATVNPDQFAISITTIDGQHFSIGDSNINFSIQSCSKPISYLLALEKWGADYVHRHVGFEPSGRRFNEMILKELDSPTLPSASASSSSSHSTASSSSCNTAPTASSSSNAALSSSSSSSSHGVQPKMIPHNPMINSGAIMIVSMIWPELSSTERLSKIMDVWRLSSGGDTDGDVLGYDHEIYKSESSTADRNWCLGYMMKEKKAFPPCFTNLSETLELYFKCCSITSSNRAMSMMAATLANGGLNPRSGNRIFSAANVRRVLPLMMSAGLYDYSGQWAYEIGVPAKSGVGGCMFLVIPNVCGISIWSPRLDPVGNSVRAIQVATELLSTFRFHTFEVFSSMSPKIDPTVPKNSRRIAQWTEISRAASNGDATGLQTAWLEGVDLYGTDYDARSLLHLTASEGHAEALTVLISHAPNKDAINAKDRWGAMPLDDALRGKHTECIELLEQAGGVASGVVFPNLAEAPDEIITSAHSLQVIFSAADGDLDELVRLAAAGADLGAADYDGRTALHLAVSNGHRRCQDYLMTRCRGEVLNKLMISRDRWGHLAVPPFAMVIGSAVRPSRSTSVFPRQRAQSGVPQNMEQAGHRTLASM